MSCTFEELSIKGKGKGLQLHTASLKTCRGRVILAWAALEITRIIKSITVHKQRCRHRIPHSPRDDPLWKEQQRECFAARDRVLLSRWVAAGWICAVSHG